jgi:hypothetical protein
MAPADLARLTAYLIDPADRAGWRSATATSDRHGRVQPVGDRGLADPRYRIEVEAIADKA